MRWFSSSAPMVILLVLATLLGTVRAQDETDTSATDTTTTTDVSTSTSTTATATATATSDTTVYTTYTENGSIETWYATTPSTPVPSWSSSRGIEAATACLRFWTLTERWVDS
ncbi:hypothetical protein JCM10207_005532 [Rhodosporidiobolus poonsookiae]